MSVPQHAAQSLNGLSDVIAGGHCRAALHPASSRRRGLPVILLPSPPRPVNARLLQLHRRGLVGTACKRLGDDVLWPSLPLVPPLGVKAPAVSENVFFAGGIIRVGHVGGFIGVEHGHHVLIGAVNEHPVVVAKCVCVRGAVATLRWGLRETVHRAVLHVLGLGGVLDPPACCMVEGSCDPKAHPRSVTAVCASP